MKKHEVFVNDDVWRIPKRARAKSLGLVLAWPVLMVTIPFYEARSATNYWNGVLESMGHGVEFLKDEASFALRPWEPVE